MAKKRWRSWIGSDDCGDCGSGDLEVYTDCEPDEACDGDDARCTECGCIGIVQMDDDEPPWILWR